jgi:hypothetical protein
VDRQNNVSEEWCQPYCRGVTVRLNPHRLVNRRVRAPHVLVRPILPRGLPLPGVTRLVTWTMPGVVYWCFDCNITGEKCHPYLPRVACARRGVGPSRGAELAPLPVGEIKRLVRPLPILPGVGLSSWVSFDGLHGPFRLSSIERILTAKERGEKC